MNWARLPAAAAPHAVGMPAVLVLLQQLPCAVVVAFILQVQAWIDVHRQIATTAPGKAAKDRHRDAVLGQIRFEDFGLERIGGNIDSAHGGDIPDLD